MADRIYLVQMDIPVELESDFNRIYDTEYVPNILKAPGGHGCSRYKLVSSEAERVVKKAAIYQIDSPDIPASASWQSESDKGDWVSKIRTHATNRTRSIF